MRPQRFVTLEGIEGAGKSTLVKLLADSLRQRGHTVIVTREPGGTPVAERLRQVVLERGRETIAPITETLLMFAARGVHLDNLVRPALQRGEWVLCDRFTDATRAYQGGGRGVSAALIEQLAQAVHGDCWPATTLLLDLPVELGQQRVAARRGTSDRIEAEASAFFQQVRERYLEIAREEPQRVCLLDASDSSEQLLQRALSLLVERGA